MIDFITLTLSALLGFFAARFDSGKKEGKEGSFRSLQFSAGKYKIHIHHWLIALIILIIFYIVKFYNSIVIGLLLGIMIQGLTYRDFYRFLSKNN